MSMNIITQRNDEWLTPPDIVKRLGSFDLDPCSPVNRPWPTATQHYTVFDNGLMLQWSGRVWLNPPYSQLVKWLGRMAEHCNGIAITFVRSETRAFQDFVFPFAKTILFIRGRLNFYSVKGEQAKFNCGAPPVLISYTDYDAEKIDESGIDGAHVLLHPQTIVILNKEKTWRVIIGNALRDLNGEADIDDVYDTVLRIAPTKVFKNKHYREKIRQTLSLYFNRKAKGRYGVVGDH